MRKIIFLLLLVCFARPLFAQFNSFWEPFPGPYGGEFKTLTQTQGDTLYVNGNQKELYPDQPNRLFRSTNKGQNWQRLALTINGKAVKNYINIGPTGNFTAVLNEGYSDTSDIYRSYDQGLTWAHYPQDKFFTQIFETPSGALLGIATLHKAIFRSIDNGQSWTLIETATLPYYTSNFSILQNGAIKSPKFTNGSTYISYDDGVSWQIIIVGSSTNLFTGEIFGCTNGTLMMFGNGYIRRSTDNGLSWENLNVAFGKSGGMVELLDSSLLTPSYDFKLYKSTDNGQTWNFFPSNHNITTIFPVRLSDGTIFGFNNALYRSSDGGSTWQFAADSMDLAFVNQLAFKSEDSLFAMTSNGLWRSFNNGQGWTKISDLNKNYSIPKNFTTSQKRSFALGQSNNIVTCTENALLWSDDLGTTWQNRTPASGIYDEAIALGKHDSLLFMNANTSPPRILRSLDHGISWQNTNIENGSFTRMEFHPSGRIFAIIQPFGLSDYRLWYSDNNGQTWTYILSLSKIYNIEIDVVGTIWATQEFTIYHSVDKGNTWTKGVAKVPSYIASLSSNILGHLFVGCQLRSVDGGLSWPYLPMSNDYYGHILDPISPKQHLFGNYRYLGLSRTRKPTTDGAYLSGRLRRDADDDCSTADAQQPFQNWLVKAQGAYYNWANSDSSGQYRMFMDTGAYNIQVKTTNDLWWKVCDSIQSVTLDTFLQTKTVDFDIISIAPCPLMTANLTIPGMRRCFNNTIWVNYCNEGGEIAENAYVDVSLDKFTDFVSAEIPGLDLGNHTYRFPIGNLASNDCGQFKLVVYLQCGTTILGQTHCFTAHAFPDTLCTTVPNWSGAQIQASVQCEDTIVKFKLKNIGTAPSNELDYIIIIDDVVMMQDSKSYTQGEELVISQPANGFTWRIQSMQEPGQPFATSNHITLAFEEGCGGFNSLGYINKFPVDEFTPSWDRDCVENMGSYDPNDKQGFPKGTGQINHIVPNQELKYLIRFQNTGTDTAFTVVIRDTLSPWLNPASIHGVTGSHPFTWNLSGNGILTFTFNNIMLPDSNKSIDGSQGFVSFRISQQPEVPIGAQIFNQAAIFFDFNAPVITNQTVHTIGLPPVLATRPVSTRKPTSNVLVAPQPAHDFTLLYRKDGQPFQNARLVLLDAQGQQRMEQRLNEAQFRLERGTCPAGIYFFRIENAQGLLESAGSIIWQ